MTQSDFVAASDGSKFAPVGAAGEFLRFLPFRYTQGSTALAENGTVDLVRLPPGKVILFPQFSYMTRSAFGGGRTLDIGWTAHVNRKGADVAADEDGIVDGLNVTSAGVAAWTTPAAAGGMPWLEFDSRGGVLIQAKVLGDTMPAEATLRGMVAFLHYA